MGAVTAATAAATYLWGTDPHGPGGLLPRCPFHWATGLLCPFCGGTRLAYDLLHGDFAAAPHDNAALLAATPVLAFVFGRWLVAGLRGRRYAPRLDSRGTAAVLAVAVAWAVVRNVA
ncbi:DUF2752 domain-containing protein [Wenjunlia tyrosinilytica]|uniref:DUF2752 domain-containing protein n=1 Tax=Wenjunlia tyrosinilytica TaxID=1544741 RepID=UPI0027E46A27|nr:DUF2752 domain-containing protein [Wenjunlia tyrosinilytica]